MTKYQYQAALKIIREFLLTRGWSADRVQKDVEDGHWILRWIDEYWDPVCPNCYEQYIEKLLSRMENGSYLVDGSPLLAETEHPWTPECSEIVREKAGLTSSTCQS